MGFQADPQYITVAERIVEFRTKYPEGSLQPADLSNPFTITEINGNPMFVVVAAAYRTPDDQRPGIGMAYEPVPGPTPYTRGSELQNAETAAWGRAIVAALAADTKHGVASAEEVRLAQEHQAPRQNPAQAQQRIAEDHTASWLAAIEERAGDREQLLALYNEARTARVPQNIIDAIKAAGEKAAK